MLRFDYYVLLTFVFCCSEIKESEMGCKLKICFIFCSNLFCREVLIPCSSTGSKIFWAGLNSLFQFKNVIAFNASSKTLQKSQGYWMEIIFSYDTKWISIFGLTQNVLDQPNNILRPVEGWGINKSEKWNQWHKNRICRFFNVFFLFSRCLSNNLYIFWMALWYYDW